MFKKILLPIDLAHVEEGSQLIETGRELADRNGADIVMVNVIHDIPDYIEAELPQGLRGKMKDRAKSQLQALVAQNKLPDSTKVIVTVGSPSRKILETAAEENVDLIMIASHQPGLSDYLLGSTATKVVRHARCAVLVQR